MRLINALRFDVLFQLRHGFYYAYLFITSAYVLALLNIPDNIRPLVITGLIFTDTSMLGFFFIGAIVLLEKGQNIHESIFVTPFRIYEYFFSKVLSLMLISLLSSSLIVFLTYANFERVTIFIIGLAMSSSLYTLIGFVFASGAKNVNDYFAKSLGLGLLISLPILEYYGLIESYIFYLFPTKATIILIDVLFNDYSFSDLFYSFFYLFVWVVIAAVLSYKYFNKNVLLKLG